MLRWLKMIWDAYWEAVNTPPSGGNGWDNP